MCNHQPLSQDLWVAIFDRGENKKIKALVYVVIFITLKSTQVANIKNSFCSVEQNVFKMFFFYVITSSSACM